MQFMLCMQYKQFMQCTQCMQHMRCMQYIAVYAKSHTYFTADADEARRTETVVDGSTLATRAAVEAWVAVTLANRWKTAFRLGFFSVDFFADSILDLTYRNC